MVHVSMTTTIMLNFLYAHVLDLQPKFWKLMKLFFKIIIQVIFIVTPKPKQFKVKILIMWILLFNTIWILDHHIRYMFFHKLWLTSLEGINVLSIGFTNNFSCKCHMCLLQCLVALNKLHKILITKNIVWH